MEKCNAPKHPEGNIRKKTRGRVRLFEAVKRSLEVEDTGRHLINKMNCNKNYIPPQVRQKRGRQHERSSNLEEMTIFSFIHSILLRGI